MFLLDSLIQFLYYDIYIPDVDYLAELSILKTNKISAKPRAYIIEANVFISFYNGLNCIKSLIKSAKYI